MQDKIPVDCIQTSRFEVGSDEIQEIYITAVTTESTDSSQAIAALYDAVTQSLNGRDACLLSERLFARPGAVAQLAPIRAEILGNLDDGLAPTCLDAVNSRHGQVAGLQVHAVCAPTRPRLVEWQGRPVGRQLVIDDHRWLFVGGLTAPQAGDRAAQSRRVFEQAAALLEQQAMTFRNVARTWCWLGDILDWYGPFNAVRNDFYTERRLIGPEAADHRMPASTGIGIGPADGGAWAFELIAVDGPDRPIRYYEVGGDQCSAYDYGSAFSRSTTVQMPAGRCIFISGTAAIDDHGHTEFVGDAKRQIDATLRHTGAILHESGGRKDQIVSAITYSKTPQVEAAWSRFALDEVWPRIDLLSDVCRDDLLFEIEWVAHLAPRRTD